MPLSFQNATINYSLVRERLQRLVSNRKLCDCAFAMASSADIRGQSPMHPVCILDLFSKLRRQQPDTLRATMCVKSVGNILIAHL